MRYSVITLKNLIKIEKNNMKKISSLIAICLLANVKELWAVCIVITRLLDYLITRLLVCYLISIQEREGSISI